MVGDEGVTRDAPTAGAAAFESARWSLTEQFRAIEGLDAKAERLFGAAFAIVGLFGAVMTLTFERGHDGSGVAALVVGAVILVTFGYAAYAFLRGYRISEWEAGPLGSTTLQVAGEHAETSVRLWLAEQFVSSYDENLSQLSDKTKWFRRVLVALFMELGAALLGISVIAAAEIVARDWL